MKVIDYKTLKGASKVSLVKEKVVTQPKLTDSDGNVVQAKQERDAIMLTEKRYNSSTGESLSDKKIEVNLGDYEAQKARIDKDIVEFTSESEAIAEIIKDIKAL